MVTTFKCENCGFEMQLTSKYSKSLGKEITCPNCKQNGGNLVPIEDNSSKEQVYSEKEINDSEQSPIENSGKKNKISSKIRGTIKTVYSEKGFGFIKSNELEEDIFFHISSLAQNIEILPFDVVEFEVTREEKGFVAKEIHVSMNFGIIVNYKEEDGFGFISCAGETDNLFFHISEYKSNKDNSPRRDDYVAFSDIIETGRGKQAKNIRAIGKLYGDVTSWSNGKGKILPTNSEEEIKVFSADIVISGKEYRAMEVGDTVSFLLSPTHSNKAICVRHDYPLKRFADLGNEHEMLKELAENKALKENWSFTDKTDRGDYQILWSYIYYTFSRLEYENQTLEENSKKICTEKSEKGIAVTIFDTGLVDMQYRELYAVFEENHPKRLGNPPWKLVGFCARGESLKKKNYLTLFKRLPQRAEYFDNPADLLYDPKLRLDAITDHIIGDRGKRLPKSIRKRIPEDMTDENQILSFLSNYLEMAIRRAKDRIKWNYKAAIPQYYSKTKRIQLLLPLCIDDPRKVDVALAVQRQNEVYVGFTILELDWAYSNARLISRPDSEWLTPNMINTSDVENI